MVATRGDMEQTAEVAWPAVEPPVGKRRRRRWLRAAIAVAEVWLIVAAAMGWMWSANEVRSVRAELATQASDLDLAYGYFDELSFRQKSLEDRVGVESPWESVEALLEESVVQVQTDFSQGSGFRLDMDAGCVDVDCALYEAEGYDAMIVTNHHVISELTDREYTDRIVTLVGPGDSIVEGRVWNWDEENDLALIDVDSSDFEYPLEALQWPPAAEPRISDPVAIGGHPLGWDFTMTVGTVSGKDGNEWLAIHAIISGGSSGSPAVNAGGRVIGVATASDGPTTWIVEIEALCEELVDC